MSAPQNVQYNEEAGVLTWDPLQGAAGYEIGISQSEEGPWNITGTTALTSFSLVNPPYDHGYAVVRDKNQEGDPPWSVPEPWNKPPWGK